MRLVRTLVAAAILSLGSALPAQAAPFNMVLTTATTISSGPATWISGGVNVNGQKIGDYVKVTDTAGGNPRFAALTLTIFLPDPGTGALAATTTLTGGQDVTAFFAKGTISAASSAGLVGVPFTLNLVTNTLTLLFP